MEKQNEIYLNALAIARKIAESAGEKQDIDDFETSGDFIAECRESALSALSNGQTLEEAGIAPFDVYDERISEEEYEDVTDAVDDVYSAVENGAYDHFYHSLWIFPEG